MTKQSTTITRDWIERYAARSNYTTRTVIDTMLREYDGQERRFAETVERKAVQQKHDRLMAERAAAEQRRAAQSTRTKTPVRFEDLA